jgi:hypothetical protein
MNFRKATDALLESITLEDLAIAIGAPVQSVRQARATEGTLAHRPPPPGWEAGVTRLAKQQAAKYERLSQRLAGES